MTLPNYTDAEWVDLERQVAASIEEHGIEWVVTDLRRALSEHRRVRYGALNGLALIAYIDSLQHPRDEARDAACEFGCGPDGDDEDGYQLVEICPVHGWMFSRLSYREANALADAADVNARCTHAIRILRGEA